jgi:hypothetical protein
VHAIMGHCLHSKFDLYTTSGCQPAYLTLTCSADCPSQEMIITIFYSTSRRAVPNAGAMPKNNRPGRSQSQSAALWDPLHDFV